MTSVRPDPGAGDRLGPDRWRLVSPLLDVALDLHEHERAAWLATLHAEDPRLAADVSALLERQGDVAASGFLEQPPLVPWTDAVPAAAEPQWIGPYRILRELGRGGAGRVYLAEHGGEGSWRKVALKVVDAADTRTRAARRFQDECRILARLEHPGIARFYEAGGSPGGTFFLALEYVEGEDLRRYALRRPIVERVRLVAEVLDAVDFAHRRSIVHRDLKPGNILVGADGRPRLLDFGIAKLVAPDLATTDTHTEFRALTPAYASPEQFRGDPVSPATDTFAVGVVLYELIAGVRPFGAGAGSPAALERAVLNSAPLPPSLAARRHSSRDGSHGLWARWARSRAERRLDAICLTALRKKPSERYQSAAEFAQALRRHLEGQATEPRLLPRARALARRAAGACPGALRAGAARSIEAGRRALQVLTRPASLSLRVKRERPASIAVLPFEDLSRERDQGHLGEGLAEELSRALTGVDGLRVVPRTPAFLFRSGAASARVVGRRLGVASVLEGSIRTEGPRLRITARLVDVATGHSRWSRSYERLRDDVFDVQEGIAESIAASLRGALSRREQLALRRPGGHAEAYECYLRGRQGLARMTAADLNLSIEMFERAIGLDGTYGPAWACLSSTHAVFYGWFGRKDDLAAADRCSRRALELVPDHAEAHVSRAMALSLFRPFEEAAREFEAAIRLNPNLFETYLYYGLASAARGHDRRAVEFLRRATTLRLEDFKSPVLLAEALRRLGEAEDARAADREGLRRVELMLVLNPNDASALSYGSSALAREGQLERALDWSRRAVALAPEDLSTLWRAACLRAQASLHDEALELLERASTLGGAPAWLKDHPDLAALRRHPRFERLVGTLLASPAFPLA